MSADEDTELRDLVAQTLESNGVLSKIKAQLRANVFLALEEQESVRHKAPFQNVELKKFLGTKDGKTVTALVREFLEFFHLDFTLSVFDPESNSGEHYEGRSSLASDLGLSDSSSQPLLAELIKKRPHDISRANSTEATFSFANNTDSKKNTKVNNPSHTSNGKAPDSPISKDDDSFFDDPIPNNTNHTRSLTSDKSKDKKESTQSKPGGFLAGAPPLTNSSQKPTKEVDFDTDLKRIDQNLADMGFDLPDDDYGDDFESSNVSPIGQTPRSARSDHNIKSIEEELEEDIEEDLSVAEDLLKSDNSGMDDLTTDRTVSPTEQSNAFDYAEEINLP